MNEPRGSDPKSAAGPRLGSSYARFSRLVFGIAIFSSAFLLFELQLILGKFLLPWFGGASAVWTTCLLFFQLLLLAGYAYAHKISISFRLRNQGRLHLAFLGICALWVILAWSLWASPFLPSAQWKPLPASAPVFGILKLLLISVGLPFLVLSSTGPLLQSWYAQIHSGEKHEPPYFLYALSNAGSLAGLLSYPLILEPVFRLTPQSRLWGAGFAFFTLCCAICALSARRAREHANSNSKVEDASLLSTLESAPMPRRWLWFLLPALASVMLLATTNFLTQDIVAIPLLWVLPLCIYLLSFVLTFQRRNWYRRAVFHPLFAIGAAIAIITLFRGADLGVFVQIGVFLAMLFTACMVCHGELARIKPEARHLTAFYLTLSAGGAFGGVFVGLIAPLIFPAIWEYHLGLWAVAALLVIILFLDQESWLHSQRPDPLIFFGFIATSFAIPKCLATIGAIRIPARISFAYNIGVLALLALLAWLALTGGPKWARRRSFRWYELTLAVSFVMLTTALCLHLFLHEGQLLHRERNFYGSLSVRQHWDKDFINSDFEFMHGRITHGIQLERYRKVPTTYYDERSGAGLALSTNPRRAAGAMRVGAIGLGIGTIAAYSRPGDVYRFYEINPAVIRLARGEGGYFTYLKESPARIEIVSGDARLCLEAEAARHDFGKFDVLIVDAFNGDSIPIHLLTREAMKLYLAHLRGPDSVIAVHISNLAVDLAPVVAGLAELYDLKATLIRTELDNRAILPSDWILLAQGNSLDAAEIRQAGKPMLRDVNRALAATAVWTDERSNVISLLRYRGFSIRSWMRKVRGP